jgi:hypothetical protein
MAAPVTTVRGTPTGYKMPDGYQTEIAFSLNPNLSIWEKTAKPPAVDGGEAIQTETMLNVFWRTTSPRHLKSLGPMTVAAAYDPSVLLTMYSMVNQVQSITLMTPTGTTEAFWGFIQKFEPEELKEGEFPMANLTIVPTNWDPANYVEAGPVLTVGAIP